MATDQQAGFRPHLPAQWRALERAISAKAKQLGLTEEELVARLREAVWSMEKAS